ncbi:MAG: cell division protein FtsA [Candidatus Magasanikbacteria bacterium]|nr:cell division protein FtsA [Candidatus Magasanikbacteria bacterium]
MSRRDENIIAGLDIGSSNVRMAVGKIIDPGSEDEALQILGLVEVPAEGVSKGVVTSIEDVVSSVSSCLENAERSIGVPIESVWLGISGTQTMIQNSRGFAAVAKSDNEITPADVERALESSRSVSTPLNYEILHVTPRSYNVDGQSGIKDPVGMTGMRLEVDTKIILGQSSQIKNLTRAVYRAGLEINDLVLSPLAVSNLLLTSRQKDLGVVMANIGGQTTSISVYEEGDLLHTISLPIGSAHITNDLAVGLRASVDVVEKLKVEYGDCSAESYGRGDEVDLFEVGSPEHELFKLKDVSSIIEARVEEIFYLVDQELKKIHRSGLLPAGVVLTGGGAKLRGMVEEAKRNLRLPAIMGYPLGLVGSIDQANDPGYSAAIGLVKWGSEMLFQTTRGRTGKGDFWGSLKKTLGFKGRLKKTISSLIP